MAIGAATAAIVALSNVIGGQFPRFENAGTIYALLDPQNTSVGEVPNPQEGRNAGLVTKDAGDGKPIVKIRHYQRSVADTATEPGCEGNPIAPVEKQHKITLYRQTSFSIDHAEASGLMNDAAKVFASGRANDGAGYSLQNTGIMQEVHAKTMAVMPKLVEDINKDLVTKLATRFGMNKRTGANTAKDYAFYKANGDLNPRAVAELLTDYRTNNLTGRPIVIGGAEIDILSHLLGWGNMAASGVDFSKVAGTSKMNMYYDLVADAVLGADNFAILAPGIAKLSTYNRWEGQFAKKHGNSTYGQFTLPEFGNQLRFDLQAKEEDCANPKTTFIISLYYDLYTPEDIYKPFDATVGAKNDAYAGVNGIFRGRLTTAV